jgi:hypothetical protein
MASTGTGLRGNSPVFHEKGATEIPQAISPKIKMKVIILFSRKYLMLLFRIFLIFLDNVIRNAADRRKFRYFKYQNSSLFPSWLKQG